MQKRILQRHLPQQKHWKGKDNSISPLEYYFSEIQTDMVALRKLCEEHQREMPTQIKLIYDVAANSLNVDYSYDIIYSNHKNKMADDILEEWFEFEKSKEE